MFILPAAAAYLSHSHKSRAMTSLRLGQLDGGWIFATLVLTLLIGYRFEVGGDWHNYFHYLDDVRDLDWLNVLTRSDPGYQLLNWISVEMSWGIFGVNLMGGAIFSIGLTVFCRSLPRPWLALAVAVPYVVIVVAMGYSRQGIALGAAMLGLVALGRRLVLWFVVWVVLGATFHKSAVLLLPIAALAATRNRYWTACWVAVVVVSAYWLLLQKEMETLYQNYVLAEYQSQGAFIRLAMNALPAAMLLIWRKRFQFTMSEARIWLWFAIISLALFGILMISPSSTAVDRVALYMLPLQMVVFSHLPDVLGRSRKRKKELTVAVLAYYCAVQFVWLNFANNAHAWLPYQFYPLEAWF